MPLHYTIFKPIYFKVFKVILFKTFSCFTTHKNYTLYGKYCGVCYNERSYNEKFLLIKSGCYDEHRCYNEREGILSADVARACA